MTLVAKTYDRPFTQQLFHPLTIFARFPAQCGVSFSRPLEGERERERVRGEREMMMKKQTKLRIAKYTEETAHF